MRRIKFVIAFALLASHAPVATADDEVKPEQLKKMYDDALAQLKAAQDRKAELAKENEALGLKVVDLQKQLTVAQTTAAALRRDIDANAERTFNLRTQRAAWARFLDRSPEVMGQWKAFLDRAALAFSEDFAEPGAIDLKGVEQHLPESRPAETRPLDSRPAETRPAETRPLESRPTTLPTTRPSEPEIHNESQSPADRPVNAPTGG